jgi:hypothetical protein
MYAHHPHLRHRLRPRRHHIRLRNRHTLLHHVLRRTRLLLLVDTPCAWRQIRAVQIRQILARRRVPVLALPRRDAQDVHGVDFLERAAVGLAHEEIHDDRAGETAAREDVAVAVVDGGGDVRCEEADEEVPYPIGRGLGTMLEVSKELV